MDLKTDSRKKLPSIISEKNVSAGNATNTQIVKKYFVHPLNSIFGHSFCELVKMKHGNDCIIFGSVDKNDDSEIPLNIAKQIPVENIKDLLAVVADCDVVSFELLKTETNLLESVMSYFEKNVFAGKKEFVLISHPLIWYETATQKTSELDSSEVINLETVQTEQQKKRALKNQGLEIATITDKDFYLRRTLPCFEIARLLENRFYVLGETNPNINASIILSGIMYGRGEDDFYFLFEKLMEEKPVYAIFGNGLNHIPVVHVMNLAEKLLLLLSFEKNEQRFFIYNQTEIIKQKEIVELFASYKKGEQQVIECSKIEHMVDENYELMTLNLRLENSVIFGTKNNFVSSQSLSKLTSMNKDKNETVLFKQDFQKVVTEFLRFRNLEFQRYIVMGNDKLFEDGIFAQKMMDRFQCETIKLNQYIKNMLVVPGSISIEQKALGEQILVEINLEKERIVQEQTETAAKKKINKGKTENLTEELVVDFAGVISSELILKLLKSILIEGNLRMRNYCILQFPRRLELAEELQNMLFQDELHYNLTFLCFNLNTEIVNKKISDFEIQAKLNPKSEVFKEELESWRGMNELFSSNKPKVTSDNLRMAQIEFVPPKISVDYILDCLGKNILEIKWEADPKENDTVKENFEDNGRPIAVEETRPNSGSGEESKGMKLEPDGVQASKELDTLKEEEGEEGVLSFKSLSIKQYLNDNVLPELTEGIIEICKHKPEDPVSYLIEFLKNKQVVS